MTSDRNISRRLFLKGLVGASAVGAMSAQAAPFRFFRPTHVDNPLAGYPSRDWEDVYRNIFETDSSFVFLCAPNDTHNCLLRAYVKNGVLLRIGPTYGYGKATDLEGNRASARWDPRLCQKGLALHRRVYGDRRIKGAMIRRGFKAWADEGFPRDPESGRPDPSYFQRGRDEWLRVSWEEAYDYTARALVSVARAYSGEGGARRLRAQGYDEAMIDAMDGAGTQALKMRGGMALLGATRIFGLYRFASGLALADAAIRGVSADDALGARGWDSYSWHTDLPPGHPMVTGAQTNDFDLFAVERSKLCLVWGMNFITTKMPDSHWLTEARLKGTKVVVITVEYSATASKGDEVFVIRPATDAALAMGLSQVILSRGLHDAAWVKENTDLPFLIRLDTLAPLRPEELDPAELDPEGPGRAPAGAPANLEVLEAGATPPPPLEQRAQYAQSELVSDFGAYVVVDERSGRLAGLSRDDAGRAPAGVSPALEGARRVRLADGSEVRVSTQLSLVRAYLDENMTPAKVAELTGLPADSIESLAGQIAASPEATLLVTGMGPNQFYNADLKDRAIFLLAALTRNVGFPGGNVGSYAGNYRTAIFDGMSAYTAEDPFNLQRDPRGEVARRSFTRYESLHYLNYGDRPLRRGDHLFTGQGHMPTPTKAMWLSNSNSVIANAKWHFDLVHNTLPKVEFIGVSDWWWTGSCEYADIVYGVDSWAEFQHPDMTASCTNPFLQMFPRSPLERAFDTRGDIEVIAGVSRRLAEVTEEPRFRDLFKFVDEGEVEVYLQRIIDHSSALKGYDARELHARAEEGVPALVHMRTYPRVSSLEQQRGEKPWHTKSGRLELYRHEPEFIESGENMLVYREPIDSTAYDPNAIVAAPHPAVRPKSPEDYGLRAGDRSAESRQIRHVTRRVEELLQTRHPLADRGFDYIYHTPKYRHGSHTTPVDTDFVAVLFGPFGDIYRRDPRMPSVTEGYVDIHPADARSMGLDDGDYVYVDADPGDRPYRDHRAGTPEYHLSRLMLRVRYYPGTPRGVTRTWHNMYGATFGSVRGHESRRDGLAKNPDTNYQSMYRYGSHQSATRAWLKPTLMTDTLVRKEMFGQEIGRGFLADVHCPIGAPREALVKMEKAEPGGLGGEGRWRPVALGLRPTYESPAMRRYLRGAFVRTG